MSKHNLLCGGQGETLRENSKQQEEERRERLPAEVYYVQSPTDGTVLVGMDVELVEDKFGKSVRWFIR